MGKTLEGLSSVIREKDLEIIRFKGRFPPGVKFRIPDENEGPEDCPPGYVIFYSYPFSIGFRFTFSEMVQDLLNALEVSPGQMTPSFWRLFKHLEDKTSEWVEPLSLSEVMSCYTSRMVVPGRVIQRINPGKPKLVLESSFSDKGWEWLYFFVKKSSLGREGIWLREGWNASGIFRSPCEHSDSDA